jgi:predicted membrane-bound mannosyltransferase
MIGSWLPVLAVVLPIGPVHTANAIIAGIVATLLSFAALSDDRARIGAAVVGGWVALSPFIFESTLLEKVLTVSWGVTTFVCMIGPFSQAPRNEIVPAPVASVAPIDEETTLPRAA